MFKYFAVQIESVAGLGIGYYEYDRVNKTTVVLYEMKWENFPSSKKKKNIYK